MKFIHFFISNQNGEFSFLGLVKKFCEMKNLIIKSESLNEVHMDFFLLGH